MIETVKPTSLEQFIDRRDKGDAAWYGTLVLLVACMGLLATLLIAG
jgi:hypothetical protein